MKSAVRGLLVWACVCVISPSSNTEAAEKATNEPGWVPVVVAVGPLREQIEATPMEDRPYRPLHFYGNTVRRMHYRGTPFPRMGEVIATPARVLRRP